MQVGSDEFRFGEEIGERFGKSGIVEIGRGRGGMREDRYRKVVLILYT